MPRIGHGGCLQHRPPSYQQQQVFHFGPQFHLVGGGKIADSCLLGPRRILENLVNGQSLLPQLQPIVELIPVHRTSVQQELNLFGFLVEPGQRVLGLELGQPVAADERPADSRAHEDRCQNGNARHRCQARMPAHPFVRPLANRRFGCILERQIGTVQVQVFAELMGRLVSPGRVRLQAMADDRFDCRRNGPVPAAQSRRRLPALLEHPRQDLSQTAARHWKGIAARQHLVQNDAQRIEVATGIHRLRAAVERFEMLGRHVAQRPTDLGDGGRRRAQLGVLGDVEVQQHRLAFIGQ